MFTVINVSGIEVFSLLGASNLELDPYQGEHDDGGPG